MLNFNPSLRSRAGLTNIPTAEMIVELQARGVDMESAIQQMQAERLTSDKIIRYPIQAERLYGTG